MSVAVNLEEGGGATESEIERARVYVCVCV